MRIPLQLRTEVTSSPHRSANTRGRTVSLASTYVACIQPTARLPRDNAVLRMAIEKLFQRVLEFRKARIANTRRMRQRERHTAQVLPVHSQFSTALIVVEVAAAKEVLHPRVGGVGLEPFAGAAAELLQYTHKRLVLLTTELGASRCDAHHPSAGTHDATELTHRSFQVEPVQRTPGANKIDGRVGEACRLGSAFANLKLAFASM